MDVIVVSHFIHQVFKKSPEVAWADCLVLCVYQREAENPLRCVRYSDQEAKHFRLKNRNDDWTKSLRLDVETQTFSPGSQEDYTEVILSLFSNRISNQEIILYVPLKGMSSLVSVLASEQYLTLPFLLHLWLPKGKCSSL